MFKMLSTWSSLPLVVALVVTWTWYGVVRADDFQYFNREIDYWNTRDSRPDPATKPAAQPVASSGETRSENGSKPGTSFPWQQYLDPKNKEFFREGDYTPPEPFMEIVRNPSDANLKLWFDYIGKKNELSTRLEGRMREYLAKNGGAVAPEKSVTLMQAARPLVKAAPDIKRYRFRLYFDSHCPHCRRMFGTMTELQERGYFVDARQVDRGPAEFGIPIPFEPASPAEVQSKQIQSVPVLLVGDLTKHVVYRINGYQTLAQVLAAIPRGETE